jgi:hypothetical protein
MGYINITIKLLVAFYLAKFVSVQVLAGKYLYVVILFAGSLYFLLSSWRHKFIIFSIIIFFPLSFPRYFPLPMKSWIELIAPILCMVTILEIIKKGQSLFSRKASLYFVAIGVLALWSIVHYIMNPVLGQLTFGVKIDTGGIRNYYHIFVCITIFLCSFWFFKNNEINVERWLLMLLILSLVIGNLHIIGLFKDVSILKIFSLGSHQILTGQLQYSSIPLRVLATLGTSLLLGLFHNRKWNFYFIIIFLNLVAFIIFGGGRANLPAVFLSIIAYVTLINRKYIFPMMSILLILTGIYIMFLSNISFSELKFGRAFTMQGGLQEQSKERYYTFLYMLEVFNTSPIFGKGVGYQQVKAEEEFFQEHLEAEQYVEYIQTQVMSGGHGAYLSTLSVFGIGGFFWLIVMLFGSIFYSYRIIKTRGEFQNDVKLALFAFLYLIAIAIGFTIGGTGYGSLKLWFVAGIVAGIKSKYRAKDEIEL